MADELFAYTLEAVGTRLTEDQQREVLKRLAGYQPTGWEKIKAVIAELLAKLRALVGRVQEVDGLYQAMLNLADRMQEVAKNSQERKKNPANTVENTADAGGKEKTAEGGGVRYDDKETFQTILKKLDPKETTTEDTYEYHYVKIAETPSFYSRFGIPTDLPLLMTSKHARDIMTPFDPYHRKYHSFTQEQMRRVMNSVKNPVLVFMAKEDRKDLIIVTAVEVPAFQVKTDKKTGKRAFGMLESFPAIVILSPIEDGLYDDRYIGTKINLVKSSYGRNNLISFIQAAFNENRVLYYDQSKKPASLSVTYHSNKAYGKGTEDPDFEDNIAKYKAVLNPIIAKPEKEVKTQNSEKTVTRNSEAGMAERISKKAEQLRIIEATNPAPDSYHTWIREESDIMTLAEAYDDQIARGEIEPDEAINPDWSAQDVLDAIESGAVTVYSSYPIKNGVFVTPSRMEAESYSGDGKVYQKRVPISDVAWIDVTQGQYAKVSTSAAKYENTAEGGGTVRFSLPEFSLKEQLDDFRRTEKIGAYNGQYFDLGTTPDILVKYGAKKRQLIMTENCVLKATNGKHEVAMDTLAELPEQLDDPFLIYKGSVPKSFAIFSDITDKRGDPVLIAVHLDREQDRMIVNSIVSSYGKEGFLKYIETQIELGNLLYVNTKKEPDWFTSSWLQLPQLVQTISDSTNSIAQKSQNVNSDNSEKTVKRSSDAGIAAQIAASAETRKAVEGLADTVKGLTDGEIKRHVMQGLVALEKEYNVDRGTDTTDLYDRMEALLRQMRDDAAAGTYDTETVLQTVAELTDEFLSDLARRENPNVTGFAAKVKGMWFGLDEKQAAEVAYVFGALKEARQALYPFCYLTTKGKVKIDALYDLLRKDFPDLPEWTGAADALTVIRDRIKEEAYYVPWKALSDTDYESAAARMLDGMVRGNPETARTAMNRLIRSGRGAVEELELQRMSEELKQKKKLLRQADASEHGDLARRIMAAQIRDKLNIMARPVTNRNPVPENLRKLNDAVVAAFVNREGFADAERKKNELYFDILIRIWYRKIAFLKMVQKCKQCDKRLVK